MLFITNIPITKNRPTGIFDFLKLLSYSAFKALLEELEWLRWDCLLMAGEEWFNWLKHATADGYNPVANDFPWLFSRNCFYTYSDAKHDACISDFVNDFAVQVSRSTIRYSYAETPKHCFQGSSTLCCDLQQNATPRTRPLWQFKHPDDSQPATLTKGRQYITLPKVSRRASGLPGMIKRMSPSTSSWYKMTSHLNNSRKGDARLSRKQRYKRHPVKRMNYDTCTVAW